MKFLQKIIISSVLFLEVGQIAFAGQQQSQQQSTSAQQQQRRAQAQAKAQQVKEKAQASGKTLPSASGLLHSKQQAPKSPSQSSEATQSSQPSKLNTNDIKTKLFLDEKTGQVEGIQVSMGKCTSSKTSDPHLSQESLQQLIKSITTQQKQTLKMTAKS